MEDYQQRVVNEQLELFERYSKLLEFMNGSVFADLPDEEKLRLRMQSSIMHAYDDVLRARIAAFTPKETV